MIQTNKSSSSLAALSIILFTCFFIMPTISHAFNHTHKGKAFFDIDSSKLSNESLPFVLGGIKVTFDEMEEQGITPEFIVVFRGLNTGILSYNNAGEEVQMLVSLLDSMGVRLQVCSKAVYLSGENPDDVMEEFDIIDNAWISSILHQNKRRGYAYVSF